MKAIKFFTYVGHAHIICGGYMVIPTLIILIKSKDPFTSQSLAVIIFNMTVALISIFSGFMVLSNRRYTLGIVSVATLAFLQSIVFTFNNIYVNINILPSVGLLADLTPGSFSLTPFFQIVPHALIDVANTATAAIGVSFIPLALLILIPSFYKKLEIEFAEMQKEDEKQRQLDLRGE